VKALDLSAQDTIAALLTGSSDGVLTVVRISGSGAGEVRDRCFRRRRQGPYRAATLYLGTVLLPEQEEVGEALCVTFPEGRSYTGETSVEIQGFGGRINAGRLLRAVLLAGARQAEPGEFTFRAWLHGRLGLDQAEAVAALLSAQSEEAACEAERARGGALRLTLEPLRERMLRLLAETEAYLDFPDDGLPSQRRVVHAEEMDALIHGLNSMLTHQARARRLREGARVVLWGAPNVGKSTLLNALCGEGRSIVDDAPGTTRDVVDARVVWQGVPLTLVDTAGVREVHHRVEREGVQRSQKEAKEADLVLWCVAVNAAGHDGLPCPAKDVLVVETKADVDGRTGLAQELGTRVGCAPLQVSALTGQGLGELRVRILERLGGQPLGGEGGAVAANARQAGLIGQAVQALGAAADGRQNGEPEEAVADWLRRAARAVGEVSGRAIPPEEVLGAIFSTFCIGK
jgi:tRNA modification GTPase